MLRALDEPGHDDLHYSIFWNKLHEVPMPEPCAAAFAKGLKERQARIAYPERSQWLIEDWLKTNDRA
jgi:hypothetical protein